MAADDEDICVLSADEFSESLVVLESQQPQTLQEHTKQFNELKNSFLALLKAFKELHAKFETAQTQIGALKKRKVKPDGASDSKPSTPSASLNQSVETESAELAKVIMMYNDRVVNIIDQVGSQFIAATGNTPQVPVTETSVQVETCMSDAQTQYDPFPIVTTLEQTAQTGASLLPPVEASVAELANERVNPSSSISSSMVMTDVSDIEENDIGRSNNPPSDTIRPSSDVRIADTQLSRLFVEPPRQLNPTGQGQDMDYRCPVCGLQFGPDTLEAQAVAHLMQCTSDQQIATKCDCPVCGKTFELNNDFNRQDFEVHVQCCCEAGELNAVVL